MPPYRSADLRSAVLLIDRRNDLPFHQVLGELRALRLIGTVPTDSLHDSYPAQVAVLPDNRVVVLAERGPEPGPPARWLAETLALRLRTEVSLTVGDAEIARHGPPGASLLAEQTRTVTLIRGVPQSAAGVSMNLDAPITLVRRGLDAVVVPDRFDHKGGTWTARERPVLVLDLRADLLVVNAYLRADLVGRGTMHRLTFWDQSGWRWCWGAEVRRIIDPAWLDFHTAEHAEFVRSLETFLGAGERTDRALTGTMAHALAEAYGLDQTRTGQLARLMVSPDSGPAVLAQFVGLLGLPPEVPALLTGHIAARDLPGAESQDAARALVESDSRWARWIRLVAATPALSLIWGLLTLVALFLVLSDTVDSQPWVALLWVVVGGAGFFLLVEVLTARRVRRELRRTG